LKKGFVENILTLNLVEKTMMLLCLAYIGSCLSITYTFDLWMSKGAHDIFVMVVNVISNNSKVKHAIIGLFKVTNMSNIAIAPKSQRPI